MKLNFALSLSFEGISLLGRVPGGWSVLGEIPLDVEDMRGALKSLREVADFRGANQGQVKLIIPNEQIRYLTLPKPESDADGAIRRSLDGATPYAVADLVYDSSGSGSTIMVAAVARETLEEAESFAREHFFEPVSFVARAPSGHFTGEVFFGPVPSWIGPVPTRDSQPITIVAAPQERTEVPSEKAAPAATAAQPLAFQPASVVTSEDDQATPGEELEKPGRAEPATPRRAEPAAPVPSRPSQQENRSSVIPTDRAEQRVTPPRPIEPETEPLIAADPLASDSEAQSDWPESDDRQAVDAVSASPAIAETKTVAPKPDAAPRPTAATARRTAEDDALAPGAAEDMPAPPKLQVPQPEAGQPVSGSELAPSREQSAPSFGNLRASRDVPPRAPQQSTTIEPPSRVEASADTAPRITPRPNADTAPSQQQADATRASDPRPAPALALAKPVAPMTKASNEATAAPIASPSRPLGTTQDLPAEEAGKPTPGSLVKGFFSRRPPGRVQPKPPVQRQVAETAPPVTSERTRQDTDPALSRPAKAAPVAAAPAPTRAQAPKPGRMAAFKPGRDVETEVPAAGGAAAISAQESERQRMTVFGAREKEAQIGGKPRFLGLMLTAILLLFLAGVAAWASVFLDEGLARFFRPDATPQIETAETPDTTQQTGIDDPELEPEPEAETELASLSEAMPPEADGTGQEALSSPERARSLTPDEADATYAETGIWQRAPAAPLEPQQTQIEDLYVASIDPDVQQFDAVALPAAQALRRDVVYDFPRPPLPADVTFDLNERGFVRATPEGAINPDGILIYAGMPPAVPPRRTEPGTPDQTEAATPTPEIAAESEAEQDRLQGFRPRPRPGNLIELNERATLSGASLAELAAFRPKLRPETAKEAEEEDITATELAIAQSAKPLPRPRDIQRIVDAARAAPQPEEEPVEVAAVAPRTVAPSIPSSTSVAQQATVRNALNLREVNLIGVYGKPASRRALVRLTNGRYQKVKVGDSIDGGRVAAIGETELRYTKSGRNITLKMPQG